MAKAVTKCLKRGLAIIDVRAINTEVGSLAV